MIQSIGRSQLLELRRALATATEGRELIDRKREAVLRAVSERMPQLEALRQSVAKALSAARADIAEAQVKHGRTAIDAAALAQPGMGPIDASETSLVGVKLPGAHTSTRAFVPCYGPMAVSASLDRAGASFTALIPDLLALACEEAAVRRLRRALVRTVRRLNALDTLVLPEIAHDLRIVTAALEEEERDEAVRRNRWCASSFQLGGIPMQLRS